MNRTTTFGYDAANRLTSLTYSDGVTPTVSYAYDSDGQRTSMTDGTGTSSYAYDSLDRLTQSTNGAGQVLKYGYDLASNLTSLTYPGGSNQVTRGYDAANRLTSLTDWLKNTTSFAYDANDNLTSQSYPNSTTANFSYDNADQLTQIQDLKGTSPLWTFGYSRDQNGQLASASDPIENLSHTYGYDSLSRLTSDGRSSGTTSWSYNPADELTGTTDSGATATTTLGYDLAHELTSLVKKTGTTTNQNLTINSNANGDRTQQTDSVSGSKTSYAYDQADRLTSLTKGSSTSTYRYDGDGLRASKTTSGKTQNSAWDVAEGMPLLLSDGTNSYVTGPGGLPFEQVVGTKAYFIYQDQLGSTRGMLDGKASTVATYTYGPYGDLRSSTGTVTTPFQYAGQYTDSESGLQYLRARYYDPSTAQFLTVDPLVAETGAPYSYTRDNPLNLTDPTGQWFGLDDLVAVTLGGAVGGASSCASATISALRPLAMRKVPAAVSEVCRITTAAW